MVKASCLNCAYDILNSDEIKLVVLSIIHMIEGIVFNHNTLLGLLPMELSNTFKLEYKAGFQVDIRRKAQTFMIPLAIQCNSTVYL